MSCFIPLSPKDADLLDVESKHFEDLEFQQLERESRLDEEKENLTQQLLREVAEYQRNIVTRKVLLPGVIQCEKSTFAPRSMTGIIINVALGVPVFISKYLGAFHHVSYLTGNGACRLHTKWCSELDTPRCVSCRYLML